MDRLNERGMIESTIHSINKTIAVHEARGKAGQAAAAAAIKLRDRSQAKLDALNGRRAA